MDAAICREHLQRILAEQAAILSRLETLLDREQQIIVAKDVDALAQSGAERQSCVGELMRIEDERRDLCRALGKSGDGAGLDQVMQWCDPHAMLRPRLDECAARAERCRNANDRNGMLVASRLKRVEGLLNAITGRKPADTYGHKQFAYAPAPTGQVIRGQA